MQQDPKIPETPVPEAPSTPESAEVPGNPGSPEAAGNPEPGASPEMYQSLNAADIDGSPDFSDGADFLMPFPRTPSFFD